MHFTLTEEQQAIAEMAKSLFTDTCTDQYLRDYDDAGQGTMSDLWSASIETGLHSVIIPEENGGIDLGMTELCLVLQAQGGALAQVPLWRHQVAAAAIAKFADKQCLPIVERASEGSQLFTLAYDLINSESCTQVKATQEGSSIILNGLFQAVAVADVANYLLISFELNGDTRWAIVDSKAQGLSLTKGQMTHGEEVADVNLKDVKVFDAFLLSPKANSWILPRILACLSALQLGVSETQISKTVDYVSERKQFGRAIGTFQAVQLTMADTKIALEALRSTLWQLCYRLDNNLACEHEAYATAWHACDAGHNIGHAAQHVHGGFGVDVSYVIFRYLYWSRAISLNLGGSPALLAKLGQVLSENNKLGWKYNLDENYAD